MQLPNTARCLLAAAGIAAASMASTASAQVDTTFTYQGSLEDAGSPVGTPVAMTFRLFDAEVGGTLVGSVFETVTPDDGVFSVDLDFGTGPFTLNNELWLEIEVESTVLGRQKLHAAPFASNTRGINVSGTGRVGIGTTNQQDILHVTGNNARILTESTDGFFSGIRSRVAGKEFFTGVDTFPGAANGDAGWHVFDNTGAGRLLALLPNGNFGVGISIPQARLDVAGGALFDSDVGIGTDTPDRPLHIRTNTPVDGVMTIENSNAAGFAGTYFVGPGGGLDGYVGVTSGGTSTWIGGDGMQIGSSTGKDVIVTTGNAERMRIRSNGNVGIGTSNPDFPLTIESLANGGSIRMNSNTGGSDWHFDFTGSGLGIVETGVAERVTLRDGGNVNVPGRTLLGTQFGGVSATTQIFGRNSETFAMVVGDPTGIFRFSVNNNGDVATQCGIICASDERLKDDITNLDTPLDKIMALRGVSFTWKDETLAKKGTQLGFVAQEVQQVLPELIGETPDGMLGVDYASLTSVLTGAVQEQQAEIETMQQQIAALEATMESMQAQRSVVGASMVWPVLLGGGVLGGLAVARRRHANNAAKA